MTPPNSTVLLCLCVFLSFGSNAQQQDIERLRKTIEIQLTQATSDTSRLRLLTALSKVQSDTLGDAAFTYLEQARKLAEKTGDYKSLHQVLVKMGDIKHVTNDFYSALKYYHYLLEILITNDLDGVGGVYNRISVIHILLQQYDSALRNIGKGVDYSQKEGNKLHEGVLQQTLGNLQLQQQKYSDALQSYLNSHQLLRDVGCERCLIPVIANIGLMHLSLGDYDAAIDCAKQSYDMANKINYHAYTGYVQLLMGKAYMEQKKHRKALRMFERSIEYLQAPAQSDNLIEAYHNMGMAHLELGHYTNAIRYLQLAITAEKGHPQPYVTSYAHFGIGKVLQKVKKYDDAALHFDSAIVLADHTGQLRLKVSIYEQLTSLFTEQHRYREAFESQNTRFLLADSLEKVNNAIKAKEIEAKYQNKLKEEEIKMLSAKNEIRMWQLYGLCTLIVIVMLLLFLLYKRFQISKEEKRKLEALDKIKSQFFANISHEFRTPLNLIIAPLREKKGRINEFTERDLSLVYRNAERLTRLTNELLELSKIESGLMKLSKERFDIGQLIKLVCSCFSSVAESKCIQFIIDVPSHPMEGYADRSKLEKIIFNLLSNAFKFTLEGGSVTVIATLSHGNLKVVIKDTGIGIPSDKIDLVFERYYQVDDSMTRMAEGSGIGLALCKELTSMHQGTLSVTSQQGKGTEFLLILPIVEAMNDTGDISEHDFQRCHHPPIAPEPTAMPEARDDDSLPSIVVAEDNADMQLFLFDLLNDYRVSSAYSGTEAWDKTLSTVPDIVVADIMMPDLTGLALCNRIKTHDATNHIPVILLTAKAEDSDKLEGLQEGADAYITKPFDPHELKLVIKNILGYRNKLREKYTHQLLSSKSEIREHNRDTLFLQRVYEVLELHYESSDFGVDEFTTAMGMSRMQFHRKLKALTNKSRSELLRDFRLEKAKLFLEVNNLNVNEVMYRVGYNSHSNFTKIFKEYTGCTPSEFVLRKEVAPSPTLMNNV